MKPKNSASNSSTPSKDRRPPDIRRIGEGLLADPGGDQLLGSDKLAIDSSPRRRLFQNTDTELAPGTAGHPDNRDRIGGVTIRAGCDVAVVFKLVVLALIC